MKIYRNTKEILRKDKLGRRFSMTGLGILFLGMIASFTPSWYPPDQPAPTGLIAPLLYHYWTVISFLALPIGFLTASIGSYFINRFARRTWPGSKFIGRPDQVLERNLKGLDDKHAYYAYSLPVPYALSGSFGLINMAIRSDKGRVTVNGERWKEPFSIARIFTVFAREGVGNPSKELAEQEKYLRDYLRQAQNGKGEEGVDLSEVPITSVVVFLNEAVQLTLNNPTVPALRADQLKDFIRRRSKDAKISAATQKVLAQVLAENAIHTSTEEEG